LKLILTSIHHSPVMLKRLLRMDRPALQESRGPCALAACDTGCRAAVLGVECEGGEAHRLRHLGLFEGAFVKVLDSRNGMLLEVKGSKLALGAGLASSIRVQPLGS
jgi:Fe2+ transport system protein FeoA